MLVYYGLSWSEGTSMEKKLFEAALPYLTTSYLLTLYSDYSSPRDKIKNLVKKGDLVHLKQGLYIIGEKYGRAYSKEVVSAMLYGPSAISLEYALFSLFSGMSLNCRYGLRSSFSP